MKLSITKQLAGVFAAGALALSASAFAQEDKAASLDQLLQMMKDDRVAQTQEHRRREAEFRKSKANQANLLAQAEATKAAEERRSERLEQTFKEQDATVRERRKQYEDRLGSLKELFGHLTSTAGDLRASLDTSIVSAQYPGRGDFLERP